MVQSLPDCSTLLYYHVIKSFWVLTLPALHTLALCCGVPLPLCPWYSVAYGPGPVACGAVLSCCAVCCALCSLAALCPCPCVGVGVGLYISGPMPHGREGVPHSKGALWGCLSVALFFGSPLLRPLCCGPAVLLCHRHRLRAHRARAGMGLPMLRALYFWPLKNGAPRGCKKWGLHLTGQPRMSILKPAPQGLWAALCGPLFLGHEVAWMALEKPRFFRLKN